MQVEDNLGDLDDTQVTEPGKKRWKVENVAKRKAHTLRGGCRMQSHRQIEGSKLKNLENRKNIEKQLAEHNKK